MSMQRGLSADSRGLGNSSELLSSLLAASATFPRMDEHTTHSEDGRTTRRGALLRLGGLAAALAAGGFEAAAAEGSGPAGVASRAVKCVLAPALTERPY